MASEREGMAVGRWLSWSGGTRRRCTAPKRVTGVCANRALGESSRARLFRQCLLERLTIAIYHCI